MQEESATIKNMKIIDAAKEMGKTPQFIRIGIQRGFLPFGTAQVVSGNKYSYYISPVLFYQYIGKPLPNKYKEKEELTGAERYTVITDPALARTISWR